MLLCVAELCKDADYTSVCARTAFVQRLKDGQGAVQCKADPCTASDDAECCAPAGTGVICQIYENTGSVALAQYMRIDGF